MLPLLLACTAPLGEPALSPRSADDSALEQAWLQTLADAEDWRVRMEADTMALAVIVDGRLRYAEGLGEVDGEPIEADAVFRWASVSKPHVSRVVHQLVDEGAVALDDPLDLWFPDVAPTGPYAERSPTIDELLHHTSGLPDELQWRCDSEDDWVSSLLDGRWQPELRAPPGAVHNYSNPNYTLLGAVIEQVTGMPFHEAMQAELLGPLGMRTATYLASEAAELGAVPGRGGETIYEVDDWDCLASRPPAWLHGSVLDLARFVEPIARDDLPRSLRDGLSHPLDSRWWGNGRHGIGPGFYVTPYREDTEMWAHDGWVTGFASHVALLPEHGLGVVLVASNQTANTAGLRNQVLDNFLGVDTEAPVHLPSFSPLEEQARWEGEYVQRLTDATPDYTEGRLRIVPSYPDGVLALFWPDGTPVPLYQVDGDAYGYYEGEGDVELVRFVETNGVAYLAHRRWVAVRESR
mgnify:CR=1 FL=1